MAGSTKAELLLKRHARVRDVHSMSKAGGAGRALSVDTVETSRSKDCEKESEISPPVKKNLPSDPVSPNNKDRLSRPSASMVTKHKKSPLMVIVVAALSITGIGVLWRGVDNDEQVSAPIESSKSGGVKNLITRTSPKVFAVAYQTGTGISLGSAFAVTRKDLLTNRHVVEEIGVGAKVCILHQKWRSPREGIVRAVASGADLAWIELSGDVGCPPLRISRSLAAQGDSVFAMGYPGYAYDVSEKLEVTYSSGDIKAVNRANDGVSCYETSAVINGGNSGGPLLNSRGEVIGVNTFKRSDADGAYFSIKITELKDALPALWRKIH